MKKSLIKTMVFLGWYVCAYGQAPTWNVNENDYQYTMSVVAFLNINGNHLTDSNDMVAAFVDGKCRGVTKLVYVESEDSYYAYLNIFANQNGEKVFFKVYDASAGYTIDDRPLDNLEIDALIGDLFLPLSISKPPLRDKAEIIEFDFEDIKTLDASSIGTEILVKVDNTVDISALKASFGLSPGAKIYIETDEQISGTTVQDYSEPVHFKVVSEDRSVVKNWTVKVQPVQGKAIYYKMDAVCYEGGAIKVISAFNGENVTLEQNGSILMSKSIDAGAVVFENLNAGNYTVRIGNTTKSITIEK